MPNVRIAMFCLLLSIVCFGCDQQETVEPHEVALSIASVPAQVCIAVNNQRNDMLREIGDSIHEQAEREDWSEDREREAILELHEQDNAIRAIVSPGWVGPSGEEHTGRCRRITERLERVANNVESWSNLEDTGVQQSIGELIEIMDDLVDLMDEIGVGDFYGWLNNEVEIAGNGLGDMVESVLGLAEELLQGGQ